jgi:hypothetical protein
VCGLHHRGLESPWSLAPCSCAVPPFPARGDESKEGRALITERVLHGMPINDSEICELMCLVHQTLQILNCSG